MPRHETSSALDSRHEAPSFEIKDNVCLSSDCEMFSLRGHTLVIESSLSKPPSMFVPLPRDDAVVAQIDILCDVDERMHLSASHHSHAELSRRR